MAGSGLPSRLGVIGPWLREKGKAVAAKAQTGVARLRSGLGKVKGGLKKLRAGLDKARNSLKLPAWGSFGRWHR